MTRLAKVYVFFTDTFLTEIFLPETFFATLFLTLVGLFANAGLVFFFLFFRFLGITGG